MKKLYLFSAIALLVFSGKEICAQNNLQFNAAKFIQLQSTYASFYDTTTITVPSNKVWKIESATTDGGSTLLLNGAVLFYPNVCSNGLPVPVAFPIWLPTGSYSLILEGATYSGTGFISAIEFNLVQ